MHHAHQLKSLHGAPLGIVHRDISPHNICISFEGVVKVLDFGIAKATADDTQSGVLKGKYGYLSPEQATGAPLDGRSDIFSLGIVLFEALTHRRLFKRRSIPETVKAITSDRVTSPSAIAGRPIPRELERIVMKALERDRMERYQTGREMQQDLEAVLRTSPASEMDLERFMRELFADEADVSLVDVAGTQEVTVPLPTDTKPELVALDEDDASTTMGGSAAEVAGPQEPPPTQHVLVLKVIGALLGAAVLATLIATWGVDTDERKPPPPARGLCRDCETQ